MTQLASRLSCFGPTTAVLRRWLAALAAVGLLTSAVALRAGQAIAKESAPLGAISAAQFSRMIQDFSEKEGNFPSDNYVSNEASYLSVVDKMRELGVSGGAYVGVGPEQNFSYIVQTRPQIAFIVDIRRQAIIQHLMYKAIFHLSADRVQFLSRLFSKPVKGENSPGAQSPISEIVRYFEQSLGSEAAFSQNLATIRKTIEKDFEFPLSQSDQEALEHVYGAFRQANLGITTRWYGNGYAGGWYNSFPTLKDLLVAKDPDGNASGFLGTAENYDFLRGLHEKNRIIPVVGDFAGPKAFTSVAGYLRDHGYTVMAFYTSNVEQYLFGDQVFGAFAENVRKLPIGGNSVFIRSTRGGRRGNRTMLEKIGVFLEDFDQGVYQEYRTLVTTHEMPGVDTPDTEQ